MAASCSRVVEDSVKYFLFPALRNEENVGIGTLDQFAENFVLKLSPFLTSYIWQNQPFNLRAVSGSPDVPPHLEGQTCVEDNIEDEWFIVYLLFHLTQVDPTLVVKVEDNDGEFLLIEAADHLPKWVSPKFSVNRVFIYQGALHIIPIATNPADVTPIPSGTPTLANAVRVVRQHSSVTVAAPTVQQCILKRIEGYPKKIRELQHKAHCYVPATIASLLKEEPSLLASAVRAFYLRDPIDMKACRAMKFFAPETRVMTEVIFTRCLYAQLTSQKYAPDRCTGWNLPKPNDPNFKSHDLGMKLACGFEILVSSATKDDPIDVDEVSNVDFNNDVQWRRFASSLKDKGYFKGELEGSALHQRLMSKAKDFYLTSLRAECRAAPPGERILKLMNTLTCNFEELKEAGEKLGPPDEDTWMDVTPEQLDATLEAMANSSAEHSVAASVTGTLKAFLRHTSDFEGAEIPSESAAKKKQKVNLDAEAFSDAVNNILDFRVPHLEDDDETSSSMSGYSDDDSDDVELGEDQKPRLDKDRAEELLLGMREYMQQMDRELAETDLGLSFERDVPRPSDPGEANSSQADNIDAAEDDFRPVNVEWTVLKNILESYSSQNGLPGPVSNLYGAMGVQLPEDVPEP